MSKYYQSVSDKQFILSGVNITYGVKEGQMCFLFKDVIEIRKKLFKNREEWMSYVSADYDHDVLEEETREKINLYLKERDKKER